MTLQPADMGSCRQKSRCLGGVNHGQAYDKEKPCLEGEVFDEETCDCSAGYGYTFFEVYTAGSYFTFGGGVPPTCCGTPIEEYDVFSVGQWLSGPGPTEFIDASTSWTVNGSETGASISLGGEATALLKPAIASTSDTTPFDNSQVSGVGVAADSASCTLTFKNGPAARADGCEPVAKIRFFSWAKPATCDCSGFNLGTASGRKACYKFCTGYDTGSGSGNIGP